MGAPPEHQYQQDYFMWEWPKYPIETLIDGAGDCEDQSILFASLAEVLGYQTLLIEIPGHMYVAIHLASEPTHTENGPWYFEVGGLNYYTCETTMYGWYVGDLPPSIQNETVSYIPVNV